MFRLMRCAYVFDVGECKVKYSDLNEARERRGNDLGHEHGAGRDLWLSAKSPQIIHGLITHLHVVTEFEIRNKSKCLRPSSFRQWGTLETLFSRLHRNISICLEDHQSQRTTRLDVSEDKFGKGVQADLSVRNCLNDSNGKRERERDTQRKQEGPPR
jgi:hypothetical protein